MRAAASVLSTQSEGGPVSGSSWEQSRIEALEKTLDEYKAALPDTDLWNA